MAAPLSLGEWELRLNRTEDRCRFVIGRVLSSMRHSQTLTVVSRLPENSRRPSGPNATLLTRPVWPRKLRTNVRSWLSQIFTVLSSPAEATHRPSSGLKATV